MKKVKKRKKIVNYKRFALVCIVSLLTLVLLVGGYIYFYLSGFNNGAVDLSGNLSGKDMARIAKDGKTCNILVMGVDIGDPNSVSASDPKRTDTLILANYNAEDNKISLISIPRDILIEINNRNQKINAAHAIGGVTLAVSAVEELLGVDIDYYGKIDYEGFRSVINAIGGVDMDITRDMNYNDRAQNLSIHFKKGTTVHLDGKKAEEFFRWRKNNDGSGFADGDLGRIKNQQMFIAKVMEKLKSPSIVIKIPSILSSIQNYVETNMSANDIIKYGYTFATINSENLTMDTIKGDPKYINKVSYLIYNEEANQQILSKIFNGNAEYIDKSKLRIKVINGTGKVGLASDFSRYLKENGYNDAIVENGDATNKTVILVNNNNTEMISNLKKDFRIDNIEFSSSIEENFDIIVVLGEDHDYIY
jgi:LCP family protein required for cell wall assembly